MKKFLALILAAAMLCTMTTVIATADQIKAPLIGNGAGDEEAGTKTTDDGKYTDGLAANKDFPATGNYNVSIMATAGSVEHRYAVDITYDELSFDVTASTMVWNVDDLKYEVKDEGKSLENEAFNVAITNYSDLPVYATVAVSKSYDDDGITITAYNNVLKDELSKSKIKIADAVNIQDDDNVLDFDIQIKSDNWDAVSNYYAALFTANGLNQQGKYNPIVMGTMSITLSKD